MSNSPAPPDDAPPSGGGVVNGGVEGSGRDMLEEAQRFEGLTPASGARQQTSPSGAALAPASPVAPPLPLPPPSAPQPVTPTPEEAQRAKERIDSLVKEARATTGNEAAALWFEAGRLYEHELGDVKNAAGHYQESHKAAPAFVPVIHAARRLFAQLGKWGMVVVLLDEELKLEAAPSTALLVEKARIHETRLARPEDAITLYQQALDVDPAYGPAVDAIARHLEARAQWAEIVKVLRAAAAATKQPAQRAAWLHEAGKLSEARLKNDEQALALFEEAETTVPGRRAILDSLRRLYARKGDAVKLGRVLERLAEGAGSKAEAVAFLSERARTLAALGQEKQAIDALEAARERTPDDPLILADLTRLYERVEMWPSVVETLEVHARSTHDRAELLALFAEAGKLAEEKLNDAERAIRLYGTCVEVDPGYGPALTALGKLFAKTGRHRELSSVYDVQISSTQDPHAKITLLFKQAELLAERLGDLEGALFRLQELLDLQHGWVPALKMASALYMRLERWEELVNTYERELTYMKESAAAERTTPDRDQMIFLLEKIAAVIEEKVGDPKRAVDVYKRMLVEHPGYLPALRSLGRLYARLEQWEALLAVNAEEAEIVSDQNHIVTLLYKNGEILADKLFRIEDAIGAYRKALQLMPNYLPALKALGGIFARAGRYTDLIAMHKEEADVARRKEQRAYLLFMVAQILDEKLKDATAAIAAYKEVLDEDPVYHPAMRALARIALAQGDWQALIEVNQRELSVLSEARDRAVLRCRMAEVYDRRIGDVESAVRLLNEAIGESSFLLSAHEQLVSLYARLGRAEEEVKARERMHEVLPDVDSRVANLRVLAEHTLHRLDDPQRALDAAQRILIESGTDRAALRLALSCALRLKDYKMAIEVGERLARVEPSPGEVANLFLQIALWKESHVDPPEDSLPCYVRVLEFEPQHPTALRAVERAYVERQAWDGLYALFERERERARDADLVADLSMKMGELAERRLQRPEVALACYERVLAAAPGSLPAITRLKDLYGRLGRASDQLRMLSLEADASKDPAHAVHTLLEVGALQRDRFGDVDAAAECFKKVIDRDPLHSQAYQWLENLLVEASRWDELAALYVSRSQHVSETPQKVELLIKAAHLLGERLKRFGAAAEAYEKVLGLIPSHPGALAALGHLRFALQQWDGAEKAYGMLLQQGGDPMALVPVHFNLGLIFSEHRVDPQRAIQHLTSCLAMQPENREARKRLARSYALAGSPAQALAAYKKLADSATDRAEKREMHLALARLHEQTFNDLPAAAAQLEQAMMASDDKAEQHKLLDEIASLYERSGDLGRLFEATRAQAEGMYATDPKRAGELVFRNAIMQLDRARDANAALASAKRALELDPNNTDARGFLADLYARAPNTAMLAIEEHRKILRTGKARTASIKALWKMWTAQRAHDRAFVAAEILSFLGASDEAEELFFNDNKKRLKKESHEALNAGQLKAWILHPAQRTAVHDVLAAAVADLGKPFAEDIEPVDKKMILKPKTEDSVRRLADEIATNFGGGPAGGSFPFDVHKSEARRSLVRAFTASPPVLSVGVDVAKLQPTREQKFLMGKEILALYAGHTLMRGMDHKGLAALLTAIGRSVDKAFPIVGDGGVPMDLDALTKKVGAALSRKAKAALAEPLSAIAAQPRIDLRAFIEAAPLSEGRAGLVAAGAFDAAVRLIAKEAGKPLASDPGRLVATIESEPRLADLVAYALSDEHFQARQALRLAIDA